MNRCLNIKIASLILITTMSHLFSAETPESALKTKIDHMVAMCETKIKLVDHKSSLFVHIAEPTASKVPLWESKEKKKIKTR